MWKKFDLVQKLIFGGGILLIIIIGGVFAYDLLETKRSDEMVEAESLNTIDVDVDVHDLDKYENKHNALLDKIRNRGDYVRDTSDRNSRYSISEDDYSQLDIKSPDETTSKDGVKEIDEAKVNNQSTASSTVNSKKSYKPKPKSKAKATVAETTDSKPVEKKKYRTAPVVFTSAKNQKNTSSGAFDYSKLVSAQIQEDKDVKSGSNLLIRVMDDYMTPNGISIPRNTFITVECKVSGNRLLLTTHSITTGKYKRFPVQLKAYDAVDSREGLDVSGSIKQEIKQDVVNEAVDGASSLMVLPGGNLLKSATEKTVNDPVAEVNTGTKLLLEIL